MRILTADYIFTGEGDGLKNHAVWMEADGTIVKVDVCPKNHPDLEIFSGALLPGFVNAHCHLELSHMVGKVDTGTTLLPFLQSVVAYRDFPQEVIDEAIAQQDAAMQAAGIVAVGDISNKADTFAVKAKSNIRYYTFVEMFDFLQPDWTAKEYEKYLAVYQQLSTTEKDNFRAVPHAPYTVSKDLFQKINELNPAGGTVSIHNQETPAENLLFEKKAGAFLDFYKSFNISLEGFAPTGQRSIHYALSQMDPKQTSLFVHNTTCTPADIAAAEAWSKHCFWATCPNANLYIENRLPNYQHFLNAGVKVCIGTDSLTSNWQLSILEEMKTIQKYQSYVPFHTLVQWATLNGAKALGFDDTLGTLQAGKKPGILQLTIGENFELSQSEVNRII